MTPYARTRIIVVAIVTVITVGIHYGWIIEPIFGHVPWVHAVHGRFCYIPIMIAAAWFGLRGGIYTATAISILVLPLVFRAVSNTHDFATEIAEIVFYYMIAILIGLLVDREYAARREQQEAQQQVERSQKLSLVGQVAAGVAHEIKNPLASIKGAADILASDDTSIEEREEFKTILQGEIRRIDNTVGEFLEFARPRETRREKMNLSDMIRQTVRQIETQAAQSGISLEVSLADDVTVKGDQEKLHQMTLNLLLNAVQASESGDVISVALGEDGSAALTIEDRGAGIRTDDIDRIFEPFFTTRSSGTGLGLAVVRAIVDAHEGYIEVESTRGKGTLIEIRLPLADTTA
jgi:signal transduction histidine kinase